MAAFSAPSPVLARTCNSANFASELRSELRMVPSQAARKPIGILTMPGLSRGNGAPGPLTPGLSNISPMELSKPASSALTAPAVLKRFQNKDNTMAGRFAYAATANAKPTRNATFAPGPRRMATAIDNSPTTNAVIRATRTSSPAGRSLPR